MLLILLEVMIALVGLVLAAGLAYLYFLLFAGRSPASAKGEPARPFRLRFAVAIPAHNEAAVIGNTVQHLRQMAYPADLYDIHVVADHCTDDTAAVARAAGAEAHVRQEEPRGRKGYAIEWLIRRLLADPRRYDAIAIFDADSQVAPGFLAAADRLLAEGAQVVQGRHVISNPQASRFALLADADMRLNNLIRNQAKENLGLSARLMGDAMVLRREILEQHPWLEAGSLTEDRAYGIYLVTQGVRIRHAADALSYGQAVTRWGDATPQRKRWYGGAFDLQRRYVPRLWKLAQRGNPDALDKLLELVLPPFSLLALGAGVLFLLQLLLARLVAWPLALLMFAVILVVPAFLYPFLGLLATRAPARTYGALLAGPFYILWRAWLSLWVRIRYANIAWVRTHHTNSRGN